MSKGFKFALLGAGLVTAACAITGRHFVESFLGKKALSERDEDKNLLPEENANTLNHSEEVARGKEFYLSHPCAKISIKNRSGEDIHSLFFKNVSGSNVYVIFCHGYGSCVQDNSHFAMRFYEMGYNVLMPHMRAHKERTQKGACETEGGVV